MTIISKDVAMSANIILQTTQPRKVVVVMVEISCAEKVMRALCDCANIMSVVSAEDRLALVQTIETLSRSLEILQGTKEGGAK